MTIKQFEGASAIVSGGAGGLGERSAGEQQVPGADGPDQAKSGQLSN